MDRVMGVWESGSKRQRLWIAGTSGMQARLRRAVSHEDTKMYRLVHHTAQHLRVFVSSCEPSSSLRRLGLLDQARDQFLDLAAFDLRRGREEQAVP